jgi:UDP-N-acetylmuramoyl-tripeptide--D-alanyl-D-alanine ligase
VLSEKYNINYTKGNFNNHIGLPFTILQTKQETEILILEMGANHKGEIAYLCDIAKPDFGIITNVGKAHLEGFGTPEEIFKTKTELYNAIITYGKGIFVNVGDNKLFNLAKHKLAYTYGINDGIIKGKISNVYPLLEIIWYYNNNVYNQKTNLFGSYNIYNVLSAVSIGLYFNIEPQKIIKAIEKYIPSNNRSQLVITGKNNHVILDAYNANPSSMNLAVSDFISLKKKNKIVILGSMLELGDFSNEEHIKILEIIKSNSFIKSVFVGKEFYNFKDKYPESYFFENHQETSIFLKDNEIKNSYILIKGSRGIALENVLNSL